MFTNLLLKIYNATIYEITLKASSYTSSLDYKLYISWHPDQYWGPLMSSTFKVEIYKKNG